MTQPPKTLLSRSVTRSDREFLTDVIETDYKLIARVLDGERDIYSIALDRQFAETDEGHAFLEPRLPAGGLAEWLADEVERILLRS